MQINSEIQLEKSLLNYYNELLTSPVNKRPEIMTKIYLEVKESPAMLEFSKRKEFKPTRFINIISQCEKLVENSLIIPSNFFDSDLNAFPNRAETKIDLIVSKVRQRICHEYKKRHPNISDISINQINLTNCCELACMLVMDECKRAGLKATMIKINPCYSEKDRIYGGSRYHYFVVVKAYGEEYLIDLTYQQFFYQDHNNLSRMGVLYLEGCDPGIYMLIDEKRREIAKQLFRRGWIKYSDENIKGYFDGFTLSYRNGLYYELTGGQINYQTAYGEEDYRRFITSDDNLLKREEHLKDGYGYQMRPLKNSRMNFKIK